MGMSATLNPSSNGITGELVKTFTDSTFLNKELPKGLVFVDFWADWCGPCKMIAPTIDQLAKEYAGKVTFAKLNIDENPITPQNMSIMSIPFCVLFKDGEIVGSILGARPKSDFDKLLNQFVENN